MITSAIKVWLALIKLHGTEPTGDEKEGEVLSIRFSAGSFGLTELDVLSPDVDKWSNYIYVSV